MTTAEIAAFRDSLVVKLWDDVNSRSTLPVDPNNPDGPLIAPPPGATREMQEYQLIMLTESTYQLSLLNDRFHACADEEKESRLPPLADDLPDRPAPLNSDRVTS